MNVLVLGRRGLGKTTMARHLACELNNHVIAYDPGEQFKNADEVTSSIEELRQILDQSEHEKSLFVSFIPEHEPDDDFYLFGSLMWQYDDYALIVDETHELQTSAKINPYLARFIRRAPRREKGEPFPVDIIQTTHQPKDLNSLSFGLSDYAYIFRLTRERDIERIEQEFGNEIAMAVRETKTPETDPPGRDVVKVNITTLQYEIIDDPSTWQTHIAKVKRDDIVYA